MIKKYDKHFWDVFFFRYLRPCQEWKRNRLWLTSIWSVVNIWIEVSEDQRIPLFNNVGLGKVSDEEKENIGGCISLGLARPFSSLSNKFSLLCKSDAFTVRNNNLKGRFSCLILKFCCWKKIEFYGKVLSYLILV